MSSSIKDQLGQVFSNYQVENKNNVKVKVDSSHKSDSKENEKELVIDTRDNELTKKYINQDSPVNIFSFPQTNKKDVSGVYKLKVDPKYFGDINLMVDLLKNKNPEELKRTLKIIDGISKTGNEKKLDEVISKVTSILLKNNAKEIFEGKTPNLKTVINEKTVKDFSNKVISLGNLNPKVELPKDTDMKLKSKELFNLLSDAEAPVINEYTDRSYELLVSKPLKDGKSYIDKVKTNLEKYPNSNMSPKEVLDCALKATNNNYSLAVLATHNIFKNIAYENRNDGIKTASTNDLKIISKLGSLRPENTKSKDKMGAWYHFFGVQVAYTQTNIGITSTGVDFEHLIRKEPFKKIRSILSGINNYTAMTGVSSPSPIDKEKENIDNISIEIAETIEKHNKPKLEKEMTKEFEDNLKEARKKGFEFKIPPYR